MKVRLRMEIHIEEHTPCFLILSSQLHTYMHACPLLIHRMFGLQNAKVQILKGRRHVCNNSSPTPSEVAPAELMGNSLVTWEECVTFMEIKDTQD